MLHMRNNLVMAFWIGASALAVADPGKIEKTLRKEPMYQTKSPKYGLLVFGPDAADRVWLVHDGDFLYVDRNGNGDLTEPGKKVAAKKDKDSDIERFGYAFEAGDLSVGGKVHKGLHVQFPPLELYSHNPAIGDFPPLQAILKSDPKAEAVLVGLDVESARMKGGGVGGRLSYSAGFYNNDGVLQFAGRPAQAPVIHFDGPMHVTFYGRKPTFRLNRDNDAVLVVGTPGQGPGTFAMLAYEDAIPKGLNPKIEIAFPSIHKDGPPVQELYELKERC